MWGEENIIGFDVHCDETGVHAHALTVPVEQVKKRGRIGSQYVNKDNPGQGSANERVEGITQGGT